MFALGESRPVQEEQGGLVVRVEDLVLEYPRRGGSQPRRVVDGVGFEVRPGRRLALVGPSGCGKTSILKVMIGLLQPAGGTVQYGSMTPAEARQKKSFGFVPQHHALLKWRTTARNVALPLELGGHPRVDERVEELLTLVGLAEFRSYYPAQLSGGMRSRASIARALATSPDVLLLDECFASLDVMTRERLYKELSPMWTQLGTTLVFITHSVPEAIYLADEIVVLSPLPSQVIGRLRVEAPQPRPAGFMGSDIFHEAANRVRALLGL